MLAGVLAAGLPAAASAAPVVVLSRDGHAHAGRDPFLAATTFTPSPATPLPPALTTVARALTTAVPHPPVTTGIAADTAPGRPRGPTPAGVLRALRRSGAITPALDGRCRAALRSAAASVRRLRGTRRLELAAVLANLSAIAGAGELTPSRLPALCLTLQRNRAWWTTGPLLDADARVEFPGSGLVWQYYPGQGIELQALASFGKADALFTAGPAHYAALRRLLAELIGLAAQRGGGRAWEYYFNFDGGRPPWVSAMAQGTALEALTRGYLAAGGSPQPTGGAAPLPTPANDPGYLAIAHDALGILSTPPPVGVALQTAAGRRFLQYSFAPGASIINAFLQTLIGLHDYARTSGDAAAAALFDAGNAEALAEVPSFDTGAWSLYQPGLEDTLSYHLLVTGFLRQLCHGTGAPVYCAAAQRFAADERTPPALSLLKARTRGRRPSALRFRLSKESHVGVVVIRDGITVFATSASFAYGVRAFAIPALAPTGSYVVHLTATDLAGNFTRIVGALEVTRQLRH